MVYTRASDLDFSLSDAAPVAGPRRVLLTTPTYFQVEYVINPHMTGNLGDVDVSKAAAQWEALRSAYTSIGMEAHSLPGAEGLPDMVFCANQTLPVPPHGAAGARVILSRMHSPHRRPEVERFEGFFASQGYEPLGLAVGKGSFEGMGDAIWHPGRYLLWGGFGFRTDPQVYDRLASALDVRILRISLDDPDFYHLDTCFSALDEQTVLIYPGAFDNDGLSLLHAMFDRVLEAPESESRNLFACNAHCPDGTHVIIQRGCTATNRILSEAGFVPVEVDTDQFLKAGGSVFCMKQMFW